MAHITWSLCILAVWASCSCASQKDIYDYLPEIPIRALRKLIAQYAFTVPAYKIQSFTSLESDDNHIDEQLPQASIRFIAEEKPGMIMTPVDKQQLALHLIYDDTSSPSLTPVDLQSDSHIANTYQPLVRYKQHTQNSLHIIFTRLPYFPGYGGSLEGQHDLLKAVVDDNDKQANQVLKTARFDE